MAKAVKDGKIFTYIYQPCDYLVYNQANYGVLTWA